MKQVLWAYTIHQVHALPSDSSKPDRRSKPTMPYLFSSFRLRTKFLCSFILVTAGLSSATLLTVRHTARIQAQKEIDEDAHNAILTFQVLEHQHQVSLEHRADLLATLARLRNEDASTIQESSEDPWQSDDCNLFALADPSGTIIALHSTVPGFSIGTAEEMLQRTLRQRSTAGWWYSGTRFYQIVLQPIYEDGNPKNISLGTVVVGREISFREAQDLSKISSTQVVFRYGGEMVVSTISALQEQELAQQIGDASKPMEVKIGSERFLADSIELSQVSPPAVILTVLKSYKNEQAFLEGLNHLLFGLGLVAVLAGAGLVYVISDTFTRPLACLVRGVRALELGDFTYPLEANGKDEVAQVTQSFDRMRATLQKNLLKKEQLEVQLRQSQKMEAMGRLAGGVAHDFNNLLTVIKGHSELLLERLSPADPLCGSSHQIAKAADRAASLTHQLLAFTRMQMLQPKVLDLNALVTDMGKLLQRLIREDIVFTFCPGDSLAHVKADRGQIEQIILNLTVNACDAMPHGGKLNIETDNVTIDEQIAQTRTPMVPGRYVLLAVTDTGQGMNADTRARIFEPFFTTKEMGKGTGLGLATVYGVVKQSGGCIWVESEPGKGARFEVYLPQVHEPEEVTGTEEIAAGTARGSKTILVAEDEEAVRELATEFLRSAGYRVLQAEDGSRALVTADQSGGPIHLLLTDVVMPRMRGPELSQRLKRLRPDLKVVYMSGYLEYDKSNREFLEDGFFLQKPFSRESLVKKIREALSGEACELQGSSKLPILSSL